VCNASEIIYFVISAEFLDTQHDNCVGCALWLVLNKIKRNEIKLMIYSLAGA